MMQCSCTASTESNRLVPFWDGMTNSVRKRGPWRPRPDLVASVHSLEEKEFGSKVAARVAPVDWVSSRVSVRYDGIWGFLH